MLKQFENKAQTHISDFKHHLSTVNTTQLNTGEFNLLCNRLTYQLDRLNGDIQTQTKVLTKKIVEKLEGKEEKHVVQTQKLPLISRTQSHEVIHKVFHPHKLFKVVKSSSFLQEKKFHAKREQTKVTEKYLVQNKQLSSSNSVVKVQTLVKSGRLQAPQLITKSLRKDPFADPPPITDSDLKRGIYTLMQNGVIPKDVDISAAFKRGGDLIQTNQMTIALIDPKQMKFMKANNSSDNLDRFKVDKQVKLFTQQALAPPQLNGIELDLGLFVTQTNDKQSQQSHKTLTQLGKKNVAPKIESIQKLILRSRIYILDMYNGKIVDSNEIYQSFKISYLPYWGAVNHVFKKVEFLANQYKLSKSKIDGLKVVKLANALTGPTTQQLIACFVNQEIIFQSYKLSKKQYLGRPGLIAATTRIQSMLRMSVARQNYKHLKVQIIKVKRIQKQFKQQQLYKNTLQRIQDRLNLLKSNQDKRQSKFVQDWKSIKTQPRIEVHLPSFSIDLFQRITMSHFKHRQAIGLLRLFGLRDPNLEIIFISPLEPNEEVIQYFHKVLEVTGVPDAISRLHIIYPENTDRFPYSCSLGKLLYYSPKALKKIQQLITGKMAYLVPMKTGIEDFFVADYLDLCVFSPDADLIQQVSKKSVSKEIFKDLNFPMAPGSGNIKSKEEFIDNLTVLIAKHLYVSRWIFKIDSEFNGRGTASFTLEGVKQFTEIKLCTEIREAEVNAIKNLITALLSLKTTFAFPSLYQNFEEYLEEFLIKGGVIEAYPFLSQKKSLMQEEPIGSVNILFIIDPEGTINLLNTSDSIIINEFVSVGQVYPQQSVPNLNQEAMTEKLGDILFKRGVWGYVRLSLLTFFDPKSGTHLFWCRRLSFGMDEQFCAVNLSELLGQSQDIPISANNSMAEVANELAGIGQQRTFMYLPILYHPGLAENQYKDLFAKCRREGISFDMERKTGSLILLCDEVNSGIISIMTIRENQRKAVRLMTDALNFLLHFAGTVVKMSNDNLRSDLFYFIDIVGRVRILNKEYELNYDQKQSQLQ